MGLELLVMRVADKIQLALVAATAASVILGIVVFIWEQIEVRIQERNNLIIQARRTFEKNLTDYQADKPLDRLTDLYEIIIVLERYYNLPGIGERKRKMIRQILDLLRQFREVQVSKKWDGLTPDDRKLILEILELFGKMPNGMFNLRSRLRSQSSDFVSQAFTTFLEASQEADGKPPKVKKNSKNSKKNNNIDSSSKL